MRCAVEDAFGAASKFRQKEEAPAHKLSKMWGRLCVLGKVWPPAFPDSGAPTDEQGKLAQAQGKEEIDAVLAGAPTAETKRTPQADVSTIAIVLRGAQLKDDVSCAVVRCVSV